MFVIQNKLMFSFVIRKLIMQKYYKAIIFLTCNIEIHSSNWPRTAIGERNKNNKSRNNSGNMN